VTKGSDSNIQMNEGSGDLSDRRPFQFTIRTLMLLTLVVALFCSAAVTFEGMSRILAFTVLLWLLSGGLCWKMRAAASTIIAHLIGPAYGLALWIGSACKGSVWAGEGATFLALGFFASAGLSIVLVWLRRRC
jgi:hypothetical protein